MKKYRFSYTFFILPLDFRLVALLTTFANIQLEKANCGIIADEERVGGWGLNQLEVVFCGDSVYLSGLAASLRPNPRLRVTQLDAPPPRPSATSVSSPPTPSSPRTLEQALSPP